MKDPLALIEQLKQKHYNLEFKETELSFQLGCGFARDPDGMLYMEASKYIKGWLSLFNATLENSQLEK